MSIDGNFPQQRQTLQEKPIRSSRLPIPLLLFLVGLFPPIAWYFLAKDKSRHQFFSSYLYMYGSFILISSALYTFIFGLRLAAVDPSSPPPLLVSLSGLVFMSLLMTYAVFHIAFGKFTEKAFQKYSYLARHWLSVIAVMFAIDTIFFISLFPAIVISWILVGAYDLIIGY
jgi:hypothetical protein